MKMTDLKKVAAQGRQRSEETRAKQREKAIEQGKIRAAEVDRNVRSAMRTIADEMEANGGIYPHNGGAVSDAELYRRAGVHPTTVPKNLEIYKDLAADVKAWKADLLKERKPVGREQVRSTLADRVRDWQQRHDDLEQVHALVSTELQEAQARLEQAEEQIRELVRENKRLKAEIGLQASSKVTTFPAKR